MVNHEQRQLLERLYKRKIVYLRNEDAEVALSLSATPFLALGPDQADDVIAAQITDEGKRLVAQGIAK